MIQVSIQGLDDMQWMLRESLKSSKNKRIDEEIFGILKKEFLKKCGN